MFTRYHVFFCVFFFCPDPDPFYLLVFFSQNQVFSEDRWVPENHCIHNLDSFRGFTLRSTLLEKEEGLPCPLCSVGHFTHQSPRLFPLSFTDVEFILSFPNWDEVFGGTKKVITQKEYVYYGASELVEIVRLCRSALNSSISAQIFAIFSSIVSFHVNKRWISSVEAISLRCTKSDFSNCLK